MFNLQVIFFMALLIGSLDAQTTDLLGSGEVIKKTNDMLFTVFNLIQKISVGILAVMAIFKAFKAVSGQGGASEWYSIIFLLIGAVAIWNAGTIFTTFTGTTLPWVDEVK